MCYEIICNHVHNIVDHIQLIKFITVRITFIIEVITCTTWYYKQKKHENYENNKHENNKHENNKSGENLCTNA